MDPRIGGDSRAARILLPELTKSDMTVGNSASRTMLPTLVVQSFIGFLVVLRRPHAYAANNAVEATNT